MNSARQHGLSRFSVAMLFVCGAAKAANIPTKNLLSNYGSATCLPSVDKAGGARYWDTTVSLRDGSRTIIIGTGFTGGSVAVMYPATGQEYTAAKPGDYVYPIEVRLDTHNDVLYIAANGLAGGFWEQTWLFAFDLQAHRQIAKRWIRYKSLPERCSSSVHK